VQGRGGERERRERVILILLFPPTSSPDYTDNVVDCPLQNVYTQTKHRYQHN